MKNVWTKLKKPILMLSPMAGYTDSAFRILCKEQGASLLMTELVSADAISHFVGKSEARNPNDEANSKSQIQKIKQNPTYKLMEFQKAEMPIIVQLFGKHPEKFAVAAKWIEKNIKPAGIDINMGCPAKKVVKSDHGATLLRDQERGVAVVKAVRAATNLPLSVKTRLGWDRDDEILEFGPKLIAAGADALIIHGRTYKDGFSNQARWETIYRIKSEIRNPNNEVKIIGNGDIRSNQDIKEKISNLDGVAIGRGAIGNPFIFNADFEKLSDSEKLEAKKKLALRHAELAFETKGEKGIIELRKHLLLYFRRHERAKELRKKFVEVKNLDQIKEVIALV
ncbi:MAG: tRNA-dihydrouridine synthase family protein [Patescibacteria group bacterium]|jgi:tRNA-dihydrouridine synthase B